MKKFRDLTDEGSGEVQIDGLKGPAKWQFRGVGAPPASGEADPKERQFEVVQWIVTFDIADVAEQDEAVDKLLGHRDSEPPTSIKLRIDRGEGGEKIQNFVGQTHEAMYVRECDESRDQTTVIVSNSFKI
ncbi:MAG: hypothetical protein IAF94_24120 [Pirellulaceae bacterium]|nr:hypothetical protein [Pirellulaceae bacterium]